MHKVFISYHHGRDQQYKDFLVVLGEEKAIFVDRSVEIDDISDELSDERIRRIIRDKHLRDSPVTIVLVGKRRNIGNTSTGKFTPVCTAGPRTGDRE